MLDAMFMSSSITSGRRFADWQLALKSISGFWLFYAATVVARAFLGSDPWTALENWVVVIVIGVVLTGLVYAAIALVGAGAPIRRKAVIAVLASTVASVVMGTTLIAIDDLFRESKEELRYQAREGFTVIKVGDTIRIERTAHEPLVLTLPKVNQLDANKRIRLAANESVVWLFFFLAWSAFYIAMLAQSEAHGARRRALDAEAAAQAAQVRALRYQVNPHFLFNTLNSLSSLVMTGRTDRAEAMLLALSTFFRTSLSLDPGANVTLAEEIDLQRLYLDIEKARFPDRLHVEIDVPDELEHARLPALLLQPIVENAIKYGVSKSRKAILIRIEARRIDHERMTVDVSNRLKNGGAEAMPATTHEGTGLGLSNVSQRLQARFGSRASFRAGPMATGGFKVSIIMPVEAHG
jgi:two-component system LytT family sensor kinase